MPSESEMRQALREWVLSKAKDLDPAELTDRTALFETRLLSSLHVVELIVLLEQLRGMPIDAQELGPGDFRDIDTLVARFGTVRVRS